MARQRKYPNLSDAQPRLQPNGGGDYRPSANEWREPPEGPTKHQRDAFRRQAENLAHPSPAGYYDPLSIMCVTDLLLRLEHDSFIRSRHLANLLDIEYRQLSWPSVVVGHILSDLAEAAAASGISPAPIERDLTKGGNRYIVRTDPGSWQWLVAVRARLGELAEAVVREEQGIGARVARPAFPFDALASLRVAA